MGPESTPVKILDQIEHMLEGVMQSDAAWCRQRIKLARGRLKAGKPVGSVLESLINRCTSSAKKCQDRKQALPKPVYDPA